MAVPSARAVVVFSCVGHAFSHLFEPIFFVVALVLPEHFGLSYGEVLGLVLVGKLLYGIAAPVAGWLGDRWSMTGMIGVYFLGMGAGGVLTGLATRPVEVAAGLAVTGLFGSIYHPVGIAWLVRGAENRGRALGLNGVFGGLGPAVAALSAGLLTEWQGWRAAFIVPGVVVMATGLLFVALVRLGVIVEAGADVGTEVPVSRRDALRAILVLVTTMLCGGLIYQATQASLPKVFADNLDASLGGGLLAVGTAVSVVYGVAGLMQFATGHLADCFPPAAVYVVLTLLQAPFLYMIGVAESLPLIVVALAAVALNIGVLPAENILLARYAPPNWRGTAFGIKFILAFGVSALGVPLVWFIHGATGGFFWLFVLLTGLSLAAALTALALPPERG